MGNEQRISSPRPRPPRAPRPCPPAEATTCFTIASPRPVPRERAGAVGAVEALEQPREVGLVDAGAVVDDAEHDLAVRPAHREDRVGSRAGVADRVLGEVPGDDAEHPRPDLGGRIRVALDDAASRRPARPAPRARATTSWSTGSTGSAPSETTRVPDSSSARKSTSSISSTIWSISRRACSTSCGHVLAGKAGELEQREQPGERRPQLVRDGGGEARAQLLVGGEVAGLARGRRAARCGRRRRRDDERRARSSSSSGGSSSSPSRAAERLARAPARGEHAVRPRRGRRPPRGSPRPAPGPVARHVPRSGSNRRASDSPPVTTPSPPPPPHVPGLA